MKQYKHHRMGAPVGSPMKYHATSAPLKHCNAIEVDTDTKIRQFQYHKIVDLQKEIETLKCDLQSNKGGATGDAQADLNMEHEMSFLKQQIVNLMMEKQKMLKKCNDMVCHHMFSLLLKYIPNQAGTGLLYDF